MLSPSQEYPTQLEMVIKENRRIISSSSFKLTFARYQPLIMNLKKTINMYLGIPEAPAQYDIYMYK
jgi:hypothetical protein